MISIGSIKLTNSAKGRVSQLGLASVCGFSWNYDIVITRLGCQLRYCLSLEAVIVCSLQISSESLCSTTNHWKKTNAKYPERWGHHPASNLLWRSFPRSVVWPRHGHPTWLSIPPGYEFQHDSSARSESGPASPWELFVGNMEGWRAQKHIAGAICPASSRGNASVHHCTRLLTSCNFTGISHCLTLIPIITQQWDQVDFLWKRRTISFDFKRPLLFHWCVSFALSTPNMPVTKTASTLVAKANVETTFILFYMYCRTDTHTRR